MSSGDVQHIPIDIHLGQISDWLNSRRHCPKDWLSQLQKVREKLAVLYPTIVGALSKDKVEEAGLPELASELNYLDCKTLVELLSGTEHGAKNMLGQYQSSMMKDLTEVLKLYEKDSIYLAELAQAVYRSITYDVPFHKKQMQKLDQTAVELAKKTADSLKSAADFRDQYLTECAVLGIQGQNIREELLAGAKVLPKLFDNVAKQAGILDYVCKNVQNFVTFIHKGDSTKDQSGPIMFAFIHHLIAHGNSPYPFGGDVSRISDAVNVAVMDTIPHSAHEDDRESSEGSLVVNLNDTIADHLNELNGSSVAGSIDFNVPGSEEGDGEVNWDLDTDGLDIVVEDGGEEAGRKNILDNPEHRAQVINELHELLAFLQRRLDEQSVDHMASDLLNIQLVDSRLGDMKTIQQMISHVREILSLFDDHRLQSLCKLHDSTTFLDRLVKQLEQKLTFCDRMERRAEEFRLRRLEALSERAKLEPELTKLITATPDDSFFDSPPQTIDQFLGRAPLSKSLNSTSQGAATGDATADTGAVRSQQSSVQKITAGGTQFDSSSRGSGQGSNIRIAGASQVGGQGGSIQTSGSAIARSDDLTTNSQGASVGDAMIQSGKVKADQLSRQMITAQGVDTSSGNFASGQGVNVNLTGSSQVGGGMEGERLRRPGAAQTFSSDAQGASTGDATADSGSVQSDQTSNQQIDKQGSATASGSRATGQGTNIHLSGSSQVRSHGMVSREILKSILGQSKSRLTPALLNGGIDEEDSDNVIVPLSSAITSPRPRPSRTTTPQTVELFQSDGSAVSRGDGTVSDGTVDSIQDSSLATNAGGTAASSRSTGKGHGTNVKFNGAAQSSSSGMVAANNPRIQNTGTVNFQNGQSQGKSAVSGDASADSGEASSVQNSQTNTNPDGSSSFQSFSNSHASGVGVRVSGSASGGSFTQNQQQLPIQNTNSNNNNNFGPPPGPPGNQNMFGIPGNIFGGPPVGIRFGGFGSPFRSNFMRFPGQRMRFSFGRPFG